MRLGYISSSFPFGPGEGFLIAELEELMKRGHTVCVAPIWGRGKRIHRHKATELAGGRALVSLGILGAAVLELLGSPLRAFNLLLLMLKCRSLRELAGTVALVPKSLWLARVCRLREIEHLHAYWCSGAATMAMIAAQWVGISWSMSCHRADIRQQNLMEEKLKTASFARFISERAVMMAWREKRQDLLNKKAIVLHVGVNVPTCVNSVQSGTPTFLCPANLVPVKGHEHLLRAAALLKEEGESFRILIAGDGPLREALQAQTAKAGLQEVIHLLGALPHDRILRMYAQGHVFSVVLPSLDLGHGEHEGIPVALMEAMSYGVPVIATRTGSIPELIAPDCGIMVPPADAQSLAFAMRTLIHDRDLHQVLSQNGRDRIRTEFDVNATTLYLEQLFEGQSLASVKARFQADLFAHARQSMRMNTFRSLCYVHNSTGDFDNRSEERTSASVPIS